MVLYQMYLMIILQVIDLFMNITHVWEKVSMYLKLEMIMENEHWSTMVVLLWNKIILLNVNFDCSLASFKQKIRYNLSSL